MKDGIKKKNSQYLAYLAGLVDGDGSITIRGTSETCSTYQLTLAVYSTDLRLMKRLTILFGGQYRHVPTVGNRKQKYCWYTYSNEITKLIESYLIIKKSQCILANQFFAMGSERNPLGRNEIREDIQRENQKFESVEKLKIKQSITPTKEDYAYLAGLFDGEGSFAIQKRKKSGNGSYTSYAKISNTDGRIFPWIMRRFGGHMAVMIRMPNRDEGVWSMDGRKDRERKTLALLPYLIVKKERACLFLKWMQTNHLLTKEQKQEYHLKMKLLNQRGKSPETNTSRPLP